MKFTYASGEQPFPGFTIRRGLGRGGFGEVYLAVSDGGKEVALKLVQRYLDVELRGVGQCLNLKHPHLVDIYDIRKMENEENWIVMEYVAGESLDQVLARHPQGMPEQGALAWLQGIGEGVHYLHDHGIVHRDLKPGNLFVENGVVKIGDYGLSKFISVSRRSGQTESVGTVHYMAPEVSLGRYGKEVDQYALGVILYEMLTGRMPFDGETSGEILMKHLTALPDLSPLPGPYRAVVGRMLDKDPQRRYLSVREVLAALPEFAPDRPHVIPRQETGSPGPRPPVRAGTRSDVAAPSVLQGTNERARHPLEGEAGANGERPGRGRRNAAGLVHILVENGMETEDIVRVLQALGGRSEQDAPSLVAAVQVLVENGMERGQDIARVLDALGRYAEPDLPDLVALVQVLLENGLDRSQDIARVLDALGEHPEQDWPGKVSAVHSLVEAGLGASEIERTLRAFGQSPE